VPFKHGSKCAAGVVRALCPQFPLREDPRRDTSRSLTCIVDQVLLLPRFEQIKPEVFPSGLILRAPDRGTERGMNFVYGLFTYLERLSDFLLCGESMWHLTDRVEGGNPDRTDYPLRSIYSGQER
jgi:hypothetical protein